jgi:hypothetical protein
MVFASGGTICRDEDIVSANIFLDIFFEGIKALRFVSRIEAKLSEKKYHPKQISFVPASGVNGF